MCAAWQLYSHWEHMHKENPEAKAITLRWRHALKNRKITASQLDALAPLDGGNEPKRAPPLSTPDAFPHTFTWGSDEHTEWLNAEGEM